MVLASAQLLVRASWHKGRQAHGKKRQKSDLDLKQPILTISNPVPQGQEVTLSLQQDGINMVIGARVSYTKDFPLGKYCLPVLPH